MRFAFDDARLQANLKTFPKKVEVLVRASAEYHALLGEGRMKQDAPWTDRTGAARTGLFTTTYMNPYQIAIVFAHRVTYGIWLEVANSGDYQVIMPTVRSIGRDFLSHLDGLFKKVK